MTRFWLSILILTLAVGVLAQQENNEDFFGGVEVTSEHIPEEGCERKTQEGDTVEIHYNGFLDADGSMFDTSRQDGRTPLVFALGSHQVIPGMEQGLLGMCQGEKRSLRIPPHLAYGHEGRKHGEHVIIPADATLKFEVELVRIVEGSSIGEQSYSIFVGVAQFLASMWPLFLLLALGVYLYMKIAERTPDRKGYQRKTAKPERREQRKKRQRYKK